MPWLLAMLTASTPAACRAANAVSGARKLNSLGAGSPPDVTAVSRFTTVRSASPRMPAMSARAVCGSRSSAASAPRVKFTSPAKARRIGTAGGGGGELAGAGAASALDDALVEGAATSSTRVGSPPQAASTRIADESDASTAGARRIRPSCPTPHGPPHTGTRNSSDPSRAR
jgi:hypothetical protein